uniref:Uncharacterized protein n=2 Tax=Gloeothece TaxID=28070 RepID=E0UMJ3_GLOV7|nr:conserved hypothetical protein [Gloeothece verrucosa PCC 7822]
MIQKNKNKKNSGILTTLGIKVRNLVLLLLFFTILLFIIDIQFMKNECKRKEAGYPETSQIYKLKSPVIWHCIVSNILSNLYNSFLTSCITIICIELALRDDTIQKIQEIFNATQATRYIKAFYPNKGAYSNLVIDHIRNLQPHNKIKLLGLSEEIRILQEVGNRIIIDKLENNCHFQILLLHSESSLLKCLGVDLEEAILNNKKTSLEAGVNYFLNDLKTRLNNQTEIKGTIEVRLNIDYFSPICYFSGNDIKLIWMYFMNFQGSEYPAFDILDQEFIQETDYHFDYLWKKNENRVCFKFENGKIEKI